MNKSVLVRSASILSVGLVAFTVGCTDSGSSNDLLQLGNTVTAQVRRTTHNIPHIRSATWTGLGLGYGYAYAQDNICLLAREIVRVNGELSRYFGPGDGNIESDFVNKYYGRSQNLDQIFTNLRPEIRQLLDGYVMGYNRYLTEKGIGGLPADCQGAPWVRSISIQDLYKRNYLMTFTPDPPFFAYAKPPQKSAGSDSQERIQNEPHGLSKGRSGASNAYGFGRAVTDNGRGLLLGNPHANWDGPWRDYQLHLTIPGTIDVMGASRPGFPLVGYGFTQNYAWTHTFSTAKDATIFELDLVPGDPTAYYFDGQPETMLSEDITVQVRQPDGSLTDETRTLYSTRFGLMVSFGWSDKNAFTTRFANAENDRILEQWYRMNTAADLDEFVASLNEIMGVNFNTIAVSEDGIAYYADSRVVPNMDAARQAACPPTTPVGLLIQSSGFLVLDGSRSECDWEVDPAAPQPGIFPDSELPSLVRTDYVSNSNNSYWYTNPNQPLTGFAPIIGAENAPLNLRQRLSLIQIDERQAGTDGFPGNRFDMQTLQEILFANRCYGAELFLDDVLSICASESNQVDLNGEVIDVSVACTVLANWDRTANSESFGDHVFREFWRSGRWIENLFAVPFDPNNPVYTPNTVNMGDAKVRSEVMLSLARGAKRLRDAGIPVTANLGSIQYEERSVGRIPIHGGPQWPGIFNVIASAVESGDSLSDLGAYSPIWRGASYIQTVTFDDQGPVAEAILAYGQSVDSDSPYSYDQMLKYANKEWSRVPFHDEDIEADPNLEVLYLQEFQTWVE